MNNSSTTSRRKFLKAGLTTFAASAAGANSLFAAPKKPGEVRVLFLFGDYWHDSMTMEIHWRRILGVTGWRLLFAQSSQFVTPEALAQSDLFIFCRYSGPDSIGWSPLGVVEERPEPSPWMTDEQEDAIIENVKHGMGILPFHCSIFNQDKKKYTELLGVKVPYIHGHIRQMTSFYDMNQEHPITKGVEPFDELDEIFGADMNDVKYDMLFRARQVSPKLDRPPTWATELNVKIDPVLERPGGWTREVGEGRIVYLNCGSTPEIFWRKSMKELMWRSSHWAMKKDIPPCNFVEGLSKDRG
jgi:type 1 glutamine amidotransferase